MKATTLSIGGAIATLSILNISFAKVFGGSLAGSAEFAAFAASIATIATIFTLAYIDYRNSQRVYRSTSSRIAARNTAFTGSGVTRKSGRSNEKSDFRTASQLDAA